MWLLNVHTRELELFQSSYTPSYAILSHRWGEDEPTFKDIQKKRCLGRKGYQKVDLCCKQASSHGYKYVWVDTCCIDKRSSAELSEAINSMFRWYSSADICYVYLSDVKTKSDDWLRSQWFTRGWTLQELLAPQNVEFYDSSWKYLGCKLQNWQEIGRCTRISSKALKDFRPSNFSIAQRMLWAARRTTTRPEDRAYSLLGIFDVNIPLLYGEGGGKAFYRLQEEIMKTSTDPSIFAWSSYPDASFGMLAESPAGFVLPWIPKNEDSQFERTELRSFVSDYIHSKAGISGTFRLRQHAFNVYFAEIGDLVRSSANDIEESSLSQSEIHSHIGIFLQYFPSDGQYHRVQFDGVYCIAIEVEAYSRTFPVAKKILISRCPPRSETSDSLSLFACKKLSLSFTARSMFSVGYLKMGTSPQPSDTSILFVNDMTSKSFVPCPCIVLENKLYIHFAYDLRQRLALFISSFEGNLVGFMMNRENLFSPSPPASIERLESADGFTSISTHRSESNGSPSRKRRRIQPELTAMPSAAELLTARNIRLGGSCHFTFLRRAGGHRVLLSFGDADIDLPQTSIPINWYHPQSLTEQYLGSTVSNTDRTNIGVGTRSSF